MSSSICRYESQTLHRYGAELDEPTFSTPMGSSSESCASLLWISSEIRDIEPKTRAYTPAAVNCESDSSIRATVPGPNIWSDPPIFWIKEAFSKHFRSNANTVCRHANLQQGLPRTSSRNKCCSSGLLSRLLRIHHCLLIHVTTMRESKKRERQTWSYKTESQIAMLLVKLPGAHTCTQPSCAERSTGASSIVNAPTLSM